MSADEERPVVPEECLEHHIASREARKTLNQQIKSIRQIDRKAIRLLRANILLGGLLLTALSITVRSGQDLAQFLNVHSVVGSIALIGSTAVAGMTYLITEFESGIGAGPVRMVAEDSSSAKDFYRRLSKGYANWVSYNESAIQINSLFLTLTIISLVDGVALLALGGVVGVFEIRGTQASHILFGLATVAIFLLDILMYKIDDLIEVHDAVATTDV